MRFRLKVNCGTCGCDFFINSKHKHSDAMECPNCKSQVQDKYAAQISSCIKALKDVPDSILNPEGSLFDLNPLFSFELLQAELGD